MNVEFLFRNTHLGPEVSSLSYKVHDLVGNGGRAAFAQAAMLLLERLYFMWLFTSCPAAKADMREISPASTVPATTLASACAFAPGDSVFAPFTPSKFKHADCDANCVPPPMVPT